MQLQWLIRRMVLACGILVLFALFGIQVRPASAATSPAFARIVDATPDAQITTVFIDGTKLIDNFQFGTVTNYVNIPSGRHRWDIALIGKGPNAPLISQSMECDPGEPYTIAAYGTKADGLKLGLFQDNNELVYGKAKFRVYHLATNTGTISVPAGTMPLVSGLSYPEASQYVTLSPGSYTLTVTGNSNTTLASIATTLEANTVDSLFIIGSPKGTSSLQVITAQTKGLPAPPQTGSDPTPMGQDTPVLVPWLWIVLALAGTGVVLGSLRPVSAKLTKSRDR